MTLAAGMGDGLLERKMLDIYDELEKRRAEVEAMKERMAREGEARVWLYGGINNPGADEKTIITIYGPLSEDHRRALLEVAREIERAQSKEPSHSPNPGTPDK